MTEVKLLSMAEAAERLGVSRRGVEAWRNDGRLTAVKLGKAVRFRSTDIDAVIEHGLPGKQVAD